MTGPTPTSGSGGSRSSRFGSWLIAEKLVESSSKCSSGKWQRRQVEDLFPMHYATKFAGQVAILGFGKIDMALCKTAWRLPASLGFCG